MKWMQIDNDFHDVYRKKGISIDILPGIWSRLTNTKLTDFGKSTHSLMKSNWKRKKHLRESNNSNSRTPIGLGMIHHRSWFTILVRTNHSAACECASNQRLCRLCHSSQPYLCMHNRVGAWKRTFSFLRSFGSFRSLSLYYYYYYLALFGRHIAITSLHGYRILNNGKEEKNEPARCNSKLKPRRII